MFKINETFVIFCVVAVLVFAIIALVICVISLKKQVVSKYKNFNVNSKSQQENLQINKEQNMAKILGKLKNLRSQIAFFNYVTHKLTPAPKTSTKPIEGTKYIR